VGVAYTLVALAASSAASLAAEILVERIPVDCTWVALVVRTFLQFILIFINNKGF
jgi:hypothetical protein